MPAKGKHRRPKANRLTRTIAAVAGTGSAAIALPLMGAAGAHAAPAPAKAATAHTYTVKSGDSLSGIARAQHVSGGWKKLYDNNRDAIGGNPSLIRPGLKLTLGEQATGKAEPAAAKPAKPAAKAEPAAAKAEPAATGFTAPVAGATIGTPYHQAGSMWSSGYHTGTDFVVPTGTSLKAVGAGTVVSAGWGGAYGNQVVIKLADGHYAQYAHLSALSVSAGQAVTAGQQVGLSGATGNVTGPHLHFEIRTTPDYGSDVDPVAYLRAHGVSL
ncbi:LysM peptidoglycan-binding domain-containing M23 family metallopeptidase [Streptomyces sp. NPDC003717]|uniref:M23 family metallopeptidase n=1 Tax=Streptomyces sp. NPDC003717 TaxID=3154276 RepID=UPI0033A3E432